MFRNIFLLIIFFVVSCDKLSCNHKFGDEIIRASTCTQAGYVYRICLLCGDIKKVKDLPFSSHTSDTYKSNEIQHYKTCNVCNLDFDFTGHIFNNHNVCTVCGYEQRISSGNDSTGTVNVVSKVPSYSLDIVDGDVGKNFVLHKLNIHAGEVCVIWYINGVVVQEDKQCNDNVSFNYQFKKGYVYELMVVYYNEYGSGCLIEKVQI